MSDRAWMCTGYTSQKVCTEEWLTKTKGFVRAAFANGQKLSWCPCVRCDNYNMRDQLEMSKHLKKFGFTPGYMVWTLHGESAQRARAEVVRHRTDEYGTGTADMVQDFDDARDSEMRWRNLQRPSMKCWSLQNVLSTSTLSFVSWMPSHK